MDDMKLTEIEVMEHVEAYFKKYLPQYTVLHIMNRFSDVDHDHIFMVSGKKADGTYAVWTCWNERTQCLNHGHYGLESNEDCKKIFDEFYM